MLHLAENIAALRRKKGVTQEEMAAFFNVTKASVSKWETGQSMPDINLLPQLATYFAVSVDALLGYEPQLSREQIRGLYRELAEEMARKPFEEVFKRSEGLVKQYYSCYPFLFQICVLWLNHFMLAEEDGQRELLLGKIEKLCAHILKNSPDTGLCRNTLMLSAALRLLAGDAAGAIALLEEPLSLYRVDRQGDGLLIQAYQMAGEREKADRHAQAAMYMQLLSLVETAALFLLLHTEEAEICERTIQRIGQVMEAYELERLHPNTAAGFYYQAAAVKAAQGQKEEALGFLERYGKTVSELLKTAPFLHGDSYFTLLDKWFEGMDQGKQLPRDKSLILKSALESLENPVFAAFCKEERFLRLKGRLGA